MYVCIYIYIYIYIYIIAHYTIHNHRIRDAYLCHSAGLLRRRVYANGYIRKAVIFFSRETYAAPQNAYL